MGSGRCATRSNARSRRVRPRVTAIGALACLLALTACTATAGEDPSSGAATRSPSASAPRTPTPSPTTEPHADPTTPGGDLGGESDQPGDEGAEGSEGAEAADPGPVTAAPGSATDIWCREVFGTSLLTARIVTATGTQPAYTATIGTDGSGGGPRSLQCATTNLTYTLGITAYPTAEEAAADDATMRQSWKAGGMEATRLGGVDGALRIVTASRSTRLLYNGYATPERLVWIAAEVPVAMSRESVTDALPAMIEAVASTPLPASG